MTTSSEAGAARSALIVATTAYSDPALQALRAPAEDAQRLAAVLADPTIGNFAEIETVINEPEHEIRRRVARFFAKRGRDDLLVLYFSCHGVKEGRRLYFATNDTELDNLDPTAVSADFVNQHIDRSRARRKVVFLDCCYSGAFARGLLAKADERVHAEEHLGSGSIVLTASNAMEYAFVDGEIAEDAPKGSIFTAELIRGLETGEADLDGDGDISVDELYDYVHDRVRERTPEQTPEKWVFGQTGDVVIARNPALARPPTVAHWIEADPHWYRRAVGYEIVVESFFDSNGDGIGDTRGVAEKLDYLEWLGVDCLLLTWTDVTAERDDLHDLGDLVAGAHQRGIRVVCTLDAWEVSAVLDRLWPHIASWLDLGVDGIRVIALDRVLRTSGASGEMPRLDGLDAALGSLRARIGAEYADRIVFLATEDPKEATRRSSGDECRAVAAPGFSPLVFLALARQDVSELRSALAARLDVDPRDVVLYLRDARELRLAAGDTGRSDPVGEIERDYLFAEYGREERARTPTGILRRLAPLLDAQRSSLDLAFAFLFSLPGMPVVYYGDELGMGDNVYRRVAGLWTPMQWTGDRNAGFSSADQAALPVAPNVDPVYGYGGVNVEAQLRTPSSLLRSIRKSITARHNHSVLADGELKLLSTDNPAVLAFVRRLDDDVVLCVYNFARRVTAVELDLTQFRELTPFDIFGRSPLPAIGDRPYLLTLAPHTFFWFSLEAVLDVATSR